MRDLTKWPRLLVRGDNVTPEQANDILIRTTPWAHLFTNDQQWQDAVLGLAAEYGRPEDIPFGTPNLEMGAYQKRYAQLKEWMARMGILNLEYLDNWAVTSSWIGGPRVWCDWDGRIEASSWNIGKWPSLEEVDEEWKLIAAAFPYLRLHAQLITDEGEGEVAATWAVMDGKAALVEPAGLITEITDLFAEPLVDIVTGRLGGWYGERGVDIERLREAFEQVAADRV